MKKTALQKARSALKKVDHVKTPKSIKQKIKKPLKSRNLKGNQQK